MGGDTKNDFEWRFTFEKSALKVEFQKRLFGFPVGPAWRFNLELFCFLVCFCEALSCRTPRRKFQFSIVKIPFFRIFRKKKMLSLVSQITTLYQAPPPAKNAKNLLDHCSFSEKVISRAPRPWPAPALEGACVACVASLKDPLLIILGRLSKMFFKKVAREARTA